MKQSNNKKKVERAGFNWLDKSLTHNVLEILGQQKYLEIQSAISQIPEDIESYGEDDGPGIDGIRHYSTKLSTLGLYLFRHGRGEEFKQFCNKIAKTLCEGRTIREGGEYFDEHGVDRTPLYQYPQSFTENLKKTRSFIDDLVACELK